MKMKGKGLFLLVFISLLVFLGQSLFCAKYYLMRCKGGSLRIDASGILFITLNKAASHTNVQENQCAWMDRVLDPNEHPILRVPVSAQVDIRQLQPTAISGSQFKGGCDFTCAEFVSKLIRKALSRNEYLLMVQNLGAFMLISQDQPYL